MTMILGLLVVGVMEGIGLVLGGDVVAAVLTVTITIKLALAKINLGILCNCLSWLEFLAKIIFKKTCKGLMIIEVNRFIVPSIVALLSSVYNSVQYSVLQMACSPQSCLVWYLRRLKARLDGQQASSRVFLRHRLHLR